jgi:hypothetical protein
MSSLGISAGQCAEKPLPHINVPGEIAEFTNPSIPGIRGFRRNVDRGCTECFPVSNMIGAVPLEFFRLSSRWDDRHGQRRIHV